VRYAIGVAERIEDALREPFPIDGHEAAVTASIGIAVSSGRESTPEDLMRNSDRAMYQAKRKGRARHVLFSLATVTEDPSTAEVTEGEADQQPREPTARGTRGTWPRVEEQLAAEEAMAGEAAIEDAMVVEHAEAAPLDPDGDEEPEAGAGAATETVEEEQAPPQQETPAEKPTAADTSPPDESLGSAAALTEARRRRRLRFPPRG
jgi:hypothetical protein